MKSARLKTAFRRTLRSFGAMTPILLGVLLLTALALESLPVAWMTAWMGYSPIVDAVLGAGLGSVSTGNPAASYLLAGELLAAGVSLTAATALIVSWVTVGLVQLPAEALMLGWRFALLRALFCFVSAVVAALIVVSLLAVAG